MADIEQYLDAVPIPIVLIGEDERLRHFNPEALSLFDKSLLGRHYVTGLRQPSLLDAIEAAFRLLRSTEASYMSTVANREMTWDARIAPLDLAFGTGVMVSFLDVTPLREATEMRRDFVANVSHELRSPLTALQGFIETLRGAARDDSDARDRFLTIMENEATRMNRLVRDLLSLSRVEGEQRQRPTDPVDITGLIRSSVQSCTPIAESENVRLLMNVAEGPVEVPGDSDQLVQVLTNLIENGVKYGGRDGTVEIHLEQMDHDPTLRGPAVKIEIRDHGEGFDPVHIPRLTERFYRVDGHRSREQGGTGLGLAIVKHIISRHRGRLKIESSPGQGSVFTVILPMESRPLAPQGD